MPIYEYRCSSCGRDFEKYLPQASVAVGCPSCESASVTRRLSIVTLRASGLAPAAVGARPSQGGCCGGGCGCR